MSERRRSFHFRQPASCRVHPSSGRRASPAVLARRPDRARWGCREWRRRGAGSVRVRLPVACTGPPGSLATSALGLVARARPASARWQLPGWPFALARWSAGSGRAEPALAWAYGWHAGRGRRSARERPAAVRDHAHTTGVPGRAGSVLDGRSTWNACSTERTRLAGGGAAARGSGDVRVDPAVLSRPCPGADGLLHADRPPDVPAEFDGAAATPREAAVPHRHERFRPALALVRGREGWPARGAPA